MRKFFFMFLSLTTIAFFCISCSDNTSGPRDWNQIKEDGRLKVAIDYSQLGFYHTGDSISGVQYEMIKALCHDLGIKPKFKMQADLKTEIDGLSNGKYDLVARLIPITTQLSGKVAFTHSLCLDKQVLVQRKPSIQDTVTTYIKSQLELPGHCISMPQTSPYTERLRNLGKEIGDTIDIETVAHYQSEQLVILVATGDMDYTVCSYNLAKQMSKSYPQIDYNTPISFSQMQAWALSKQSPELLKKINAWLDKNADKYFK